MARPARQEQTGSARSSHQLIRFYRSINPDRVFGTHRLEFPACEACNNNTGHSDLIAAMLSRALPSPESDLQKRDFKKLIAAVSNNVPQVLFEMKIGRAATGRLALSR